MIGDSGGFGAQIQDKATKIKSMGMNKRLT
jgi:hypothetical protein